MHNDDGKICRNFQLVIFIIKALKKAKTRQFLLRTICYTPRGSYLRVGIS